MAVDLCWKQGMHGMLKKRGVIQRIFGILQKN
jgi:hypothetical protein